MTSPVLALAQSNRVTIPDFVGMSYPMYNGKIVESHVGNAVTYAIKTNAGVDPSPVAPVKIGFTQSNGSYVERAVIAATSVTLPSGATLGMPSGFCFQVAIAAIDNAGTVELAAASRIGNTTAAGSLAAALYLDESLPMSTIAASGSSTAGATFYSTTARSNVQARIVARADYDSGLFTTGLWAAAPNRIVLERSGRPTALTPGFYAHKNNVSQTGLLDSNYTQLTFSTTRFNVGGFFNTGTGLWTPPAGLVELSAMVWLQANVANSPADVVAKIWKNGQTIEIGAGPGFTPSGFPNTGGSAIPRVLDLANGTDSYGLFVFSTNVGGANIGVADGNPAHTWFTGNLVR